MMIDGYIDDYFERIAYKLREYAPYPRPDVVPDELIKMLLDAIDDPRGDSDVRGYLRRRLKTEPHDKFINYLLDELYYRLDEMRERADEGLEDQQGHSICADCGQSFIDDRDPRDSWWFVRFEPVCRACYAIRAVKFERCARCNHALPDPVWHRGGPNGRVLYFCADHY